MRRTGSISYNGDFAELTDNLRGESSGSIAEGNTAKASPLLSSGQRRRTNIERSHSVERFPLHFRIGFGRPSGQGRGPDLRRGSWTPSSRRTRTRASPPRRLVTTGLVVLAGEITTHAVIDYQTVARDVIKRIGYDNSDYGIDYKGCAVLVCYDKQ